MRISVSSLREGLGWGLGGNDIQYYPNGYELVILCYRVVV